MTDIDDEVLNGLAAKIDSLDLTETERAMLDGLFERAEAYEPDVEGFAFNHAAYGSYRGDRSGASLSGTSLKMAGGLGFITRPSLGYGDPLDPTKGGGGGPGKPPPP